MAKVLLISLDIVGKSMAGPAIRYFEFAQALSKHHEVVLMTPNATDLPPTSFRLTRYINMQEEVKNCDVVICQILPVRLMFWLYIFKKKVIIDSYDPQPLENLEIFKTLPLNLRDNRNEFILNIIENAMDVADGILCANEPQRDLWLGYLMARRSITPTLYDEDPSLSHWLVQIPFGLPNHPLKDRKGVRERFGIKESDTLLLWGGGIWNWFDPLSLIRAVYELSKNHGDVKLVFMGIKHPNEVVPEMQMAREAVALASELDLTDKHVFFNFGWTPYEEREAFLSEADIGVSTHFDHLETRYAFRTRMLDYLWASLPIIATQGDSFAELIEARGAGISVGFRDPQAIADAILKIRENPEKYKKCSQELSKDFTWQKVTEPLSRLIDRLVPLKPKGVKLGALLRGIWRVRSPFAKNTEKEINALMSKKS